MYFGILSIFYYLLLSYPSNPTVLYFSIFCIGCYFLPWPVRFFAIYYTTHLVLYGSLYSPCTFCNCSTRAYTRIYPPPFIDLYYLKYFFIALLVSSRSHHFIFSAWPIFYFFILTCSLMRLFFLHKKHQSEINALRMQMNPILFPNALNSLGQLIKKSGKDKRHPVQQRGW